MSIRNYNAFLKAAKSHHGISHREAQAMYRGVSERLGRSAIGADVRRHPRISAQEATKAEKRVQREARREARESRAKERRESGERSRRDVVKLDYYNYEDWDDFLDIFDEWESSEEY